MTDVPEYLDAMDAAFWDGPRPDPPVPRVLAALGPKMLELARRRSRGAIPYLVPVAHTRFAREKLGPGPVLAVHQAVVIGEPARRARDLAHEHLARYLGAENYRKNFLRFGFTESDVAGAGSERLIDAIVAMGDVDDVAARVREHLEAGADHVCVNPLGRALNEIPVARLRELAERFERVSRG